jgi:hypothetical protein
MDPIGSANSSASQTVQAIQASQANAANAAKTKAVIDGLPPVLLASAASSNTVNAALVSSQWGLDPGTVGGVYGGAGANGGMFAGNSLLPLLTTISHANAEQALALMRIKTPTPGAATAATPSASSADATSTKGRAVLDQAGASASGPVMVDPLWGRSA